MGVLYMDATLLPKAARCCPPKWVINFGFPIRLEKREVSRDKYF